MNLNRILTTDEKDQFIKMFQSYVNEQLIPSGSVKDKLATYNMAKALGLDDSLTDLGLTKASIDHYYSHQTK